MIELIGFSVIATCFLLFWIVVFPHEVINSVLFCDIQSKSDCFVSAVTWLFIGGFINGVVLLVRYAA